MKKWIIALTLMLALLCTTAAAKEAGGTPVTLTVRATVLQAYLNDTSCARELIARLPVTRAKCRCSSRARNCTGWPT